MPILNESRVEQSWFKGERTQNATTWAILLDHLALLGNPNVLRTLNIPDLVPYTHPGSASCLHLFQPKHRFAMW